MKSAFSILTLVSMGWLAALSPSMAGSVGAQDVYEDAAGGFRVEVPEGWGIRQMPGLAYRLLIGPGSDGFAPNLTFVDERFGGSLEQYVEYNLAAMERVFVGFRLESQAMLTGESGHSIHKIVVVNVQDGRELRQAFYLLQGGDRYFVITGTKQSSDARDFDGIFDSVARSFRLID